MKSVAGESKIHTGVPLLDEQAVFQAPNPTTPNEKREPLARLIN